MLKNVKKLFPKDTGKVILSECGEWLTNGCYGYHVEILPQDLVSILGNEPVLRQMLGMSKRVEFYVSENQVRPDFKQVSEKILAENNNVYFRTPWKYCYEGSLIVYMHQDSMALFDDSVMENTHYHELIGNGDEMTPMISRDGHFVACSYLLDSLGDKSHRLTQWIVE